MSKKILQVAGSLKIGGAEKVARDIALYDDSGNFDYHYLSYEESGDYESILQEKGCHIVRLPKPGEGYLNHLKSLWRIMSEQDYYAVHAHTMFNCGWAMLVAKIKGVPVRVSHAHSALSIGYGVVNLAYEKLMRFVILTCSTDLVGCSVKAGRRLFGETAWGKRGNLILNGIDVTGFAYDAQKRKNVRTQLRLGNRFVMGHAGHLAGVKNQSFLLDLMPLVLKKKPNALLLLLGEGEDRPMLEQKIRDLKLQDHVIMTGNVTNVADYLSAMDVFVFPSLYEGLPLSILEVQANGLPCVISDRVPEDAFLTDLMHPLPLEDYKEKWVDAILSVQRSEPQAYNDLLRESDYAVETAMEKIYRIYEKG